MPQWLLTYYSVSLALPVLPSFIALDLQTSEYCAYLLLKGSCSQSIFYRVLIVFVGGLLSVVQK